VFVPIILFPSQGQGWLLKLKINIWIRAIRLIYYPTSTAPGSGGSFKNRKPIREVRCCESRMAERSHWWTERWLELCFLGWLRWLQWSPRPRLQDVGWCSAAVVVVVV
jgi:hypothetical protein